MKKKPKTLYMLSCGSYSDYRVVGIFSTPEKWAEAEKLYGDTNEMDEIQLDEMPYHPPGLYAWSVHMNAHGDTEQLGREVAALEHDSSEHFIPGVWFSPYGRGYGYFYVWAEDAEHAVKVVNEWRTRIIALNLWPLEPSGGKSFIALRPGVDF